MTKLYTIERIDGGEVVVEDVRLSLADAMDECQRRTDDTEEPHAVSSVEVELPGKNLVRCVDSTCEEVTCHRSTEGCDGDHSGGRNGPCNGPNAPEHPAMYEAGEGFV